MTFPELQTLARTLDPKAVSDSLRGLAEDPRFAAVLALFERERESYRRAIASQALAPHHGSLAHCAGSLYALDRLQDALAQLFARKPGSGLKPSEESMQRE